MSGALLAIKKTAIGAEVAIIHDLYQPLIIIILAVLTGTGGGVIRDVLAKRNTLCISERSLCRSLCFRCDFIYYSI